MLLLNIAGYAEPDALLDTTIENIQTTFTINVFSLIVLTRECVKYMRNHPSKIVNVASTAGVTPRPGWLAYASSKAAVVSMAQTLADELAEYKIKVYSDLARPVCYRAPPQARARGGPHDDHAARARR